MTESSEQESTSNQWGQNGIAFKREMRIDCQTIGVITGQRRRVDWVLSETDSEKELAAQVPYCKSVHGNHKRGTKQLSCESLQTSMQT